MTWLTPEDVAALTGRTVRHERRRANSGAYGEVKRVISGRNANGLRIALERIEETAQAKYRATHPHLLPASTTPATLQYKTASDAQRARADQRLEVVTAYQRFLEEDFHPRNRTIAKEEWVAAYKECNDIDRLSVDSLDRWCSEFRKHGLDGLVDRNDGSARRDKVTIPPALQAEFKAQYLKATKPSVSLCYRELKKIAAVRGWSLPPRATFYRFAESLPPSVKQFYRENKDNRHSSLRPFILRDYESINAMEIIQSDHHQIDVAVSCGDPLCKVGHYPWLTVWIDLRSRKILVADLYVEYPNSQRILQALQRAWIEFGLSEWVYVDNGMDYIKAVGAWGVKHFDVARRTATLQKVTGWSPAIIVRAAGLFGVQAVHSIARNPQSKLVERWFETLMFWLYPKFESYRGALGQRSDRAEYLRSHPAELPSLTDFAIELHRAVDEYNETPHRGDGMDGRSPNEVFEATRIPIRIPDRAALAHAFEWQETTGTVQRNGVRFLHVWYALPPAAQAEHYRHTVILRYHPEALDSLVLCDATGAFICVATARNKVTQRRGGHELATGMSDLGAEWNAVKAEIRMHNPGAAKRLEQSKADVEEYYRLRQHMLEAAAPVAASGGSGVVTVMDTHMSSLARQVAAAQESIARGGVSAADFELSRTVDRASIDDLENAAREHSLYAVPSRADEHDETDINRELEAAQIRRVARERKDEGLCAFDLECPNLGDFAQGFCFPHYQRVFGD